MSFTWFKSKIILQRMETFIGQEAEVLVESVSKTGQLKGRTRCWKKVIFTGEKELKGTLQTVQVTGCNHQTLLGELVPTQQPKLVVSS